MIKINKDNKNIFQICIKLNDNIDSLKMSRKTMLSLNPDYDFHYITTEEELKEFMQIHFKSSEDLFEQKIYESFDAISDKLNYGAKAGRTEDKTQKDKNRNVCILVSRTDIFRYAVLYKFGGLYLDLSSRFEVSIGEQIEKHDCMIIHKGDEIPSSIIYAKKHNSIIRNVLENIIKNCSYETSSKTLSQYKHVGPYVLTRTVLNFSTEFSNEKKFENPDSKTVIDCLKILDTNALLEKYNCIVLPQEKSVIDIQAEWKRQLHNLDPSNPDLVPNEHWLLNY